MKKESIDRIVTLLQPFLPQKITPVYKPVNLLCVPNADYHNCDLLRDLRMAVDAGNCLIQIKKCDAVCDSDFYQKFMALQLHKNDFRGDITPLLSNVFESDYNEQDNFANYLAPIREWPKPGSDFQVSAQCTRKGRHILLASYGYKNITAYYNAGCFCYKPKVLIIELLGRHSDIDKIEIDELRNVLFNNL